MVTARAFVLLEPEAGASAQQVEVDDPGRGEVRVRMVASGVCATDRRATLGQSPIPRYPVVLGHEGAGIVEVVGEGVVGLNVGDHVLFARSGPCGECRECIRGHAEYCHSDRQRQRLFGVMDDGRSRVRLDGEEVFPLYGGTLSERMVARADHVVRLDPEIPLDEFCVVGCSVITGLGAVFNTAGVRRGDTVAVVGCGGVGLNVVQGARIAGATTIVAVDPVAEKRSLAQRLGATHCMSGDDLVSQLHDVVPGGVDHVFEVVGNTQVLAECLRCARIGGGVVMVGIPGPGSTIPVDAFTLLQGRRLVGCRGGDVVPQRDIPIVADLYRSGQLSLEPMLGARLSLDDVDIALDHLAAGGVGRTIVILDA